MTERDADAIPASVHDAAERWLLRRESGLAPAAEREFATWLAVDPVHARAYAQVERIWRESRLLAASSVGRARRLPRAPFYMRHSTHVAAAGVGLAAVFGVVVVGVFHQANPFALVSPAEAATYRTGVGEIRAYRLPDGSQIILDTATTVKFSIVAGSRRVVLERGRVRVQVAADAAHPFIVAVRGGEVVAQGRIFDVSVADGTPRVAVLDGAAVLRASGDTGAQHTLVAGEQSTLAGEAPTAIAPADARWVSGMLVLAATPLGDAIAAINRYNDVQVRLADPALRALKVTGAFRARDPRGFARAVAATFGLAVTAQDGAAITLARSSRQEALSPQK